MKEETTNEQKSFKLFKMEYLLWKENVRLLRHSVSSKVWVSKIVVSHNVCKNLNIKDFLDHCMGAVCLNHKEY
jgi:hypothetical protein